MECEKLRTIFTKDRMKEVFRTEIIKELDALKRRVLAIKMAQSLGLLEKSDKEV